MFFLGDHFFEHYFAFLFRLGVDGMDFKLALGVSRRISALGEVADQLMDAAGAVLLDFSRVKGERWANRRFFVLAGELVDPPAFRGIRRLRCDLTRARSTAPSVAAWPR